MSKKKRAAPARHGASAASSQQAVKRGGDGRLHLLLHRDARGQQHLSMSLPVFAEAWQNEVATGAANTALAIFGGERSVEGAAELARRVMGATSRLAEGLLARAAAGSVACKAGCDHCCHQSVAATVPEALAIASHLAQTRSADELAALRARLAERFERTRGLSADERFSPELPCAFLVAGTCSIYEVRPLVCRGMNSLDAHECELRLRDAAARAEFLKRGAGGHCYLEPIGAAQAVSAGLQLGLSELFGLDMRPLDLTAALHLLLTDGAPKQQAWLRGEMPLGDAVLMSAAENRELPLTVSPRQ